MKKEEIQSIDFWRRKPDAVDCLEECHLDFVPQGRYEIHIDGKTTAGALSDEDIEKIYRFLNDEIHLEEDLKDFRAFSYESNPKDFSLSFFLTVLFRNKIYFAVKGCSPSKEKHFHEILGFFADFMYAKQ